MIMQGNNKATTRQQQGNNKATTRQQQGNNNKTLTKYIKILRPDHWVKQFFIVPGSIAALLLTKSKFDSEHSINIILGFIAVSLIASANYAINEYLDAEFDKYHPVKKFRSVVSGGVKGSIVWALWAALSLAGFAASSLLSINFLAVIIWLWLMGILYNVKPFRTKDIVYLDVLTESINNAIRLIAGWFIISESTLPPVSLIAGYWFGGAFLMAVKRFAEYRMINDSKLAGLYRRSFKYYSEKSLLISSFFYAMCSVFFTGVFLIKYRIELILFMPALTGLFCYYFYLSFENDSAVQKPEKLYHEKGLMLYCAGLTVLFIVLLIMHIPALKFFTNTELISLR